MENRLLQFFLARRSVQRNGICPKYIMLHFIVVTAIFASHNCFADSVLSSFIDNVLQSNPIIQAAEARVAAATARERAMGNPLYNPEISAQKENALENIISVGVSQTVDWTNKRKTRGNVGMENTMIARAELSEMRQQLALKIFIALAKYQTEKNSLTLSQRRTGLLKQFVQLTKSRYDKGDVARVDLDLAQLALSEAIAQEADTEVNLNAALQQLQALSGIQHTQWPLLPDKLPILNSHEINAETLAYTIPEVLVAHYESQTAKARIKVAAKERYPDPTIGIQGGKSSSDNESKRLIGVTLSMPVYIRNSYSAELDAANYDAIESTKKYEAVIRHSKAEIVGSAHRYQLLKSAITMWKATSAASLTDGMVLIQRLWQAGEISSAEYIVQLKQRIDTQISGVELNGRAWGAWAEWMKASGKVEHWLRLKSFQTGVHM